MEVSTTVRGLVVLRMKRASADATLHMVEAKGGGRMPRAELKRTLVV